MLLEMGGCGALGQAWCSAYFWPQGPQWRSGGGLVGGQTWFRVFVLRGYYRYAFFCGRVARVPAQ